MTNNLFAFVFVVLSSLFYPQEKTLAQQAATGAERMSSTSSSTKTAPAVGVEKSADMESARTSGGTGSSQMRLEVEYVEEDGTTGEYSSQDQIHPDQNRSKEIRFRSRKGGTRKTLQLSPRKFKRGGHAIDNYFDLLKSRNGKSLIVTETFNDRDEINAYRLLKDMSSIMTWYDSSGDVLCRKEFNARTWPVLLSEDGSTLVVLRGTCDLGEDCILDGSVKSPEWKMLDTEQLQVLDRNCRVILDRTGFFHDPKISPSAKWLHYVNGSVLVAVNLNNGKEYGMQPIRDVYAHAIQDDGALIQWRSFRAGTKHREKKWIWRPGDSGFTETDEERPME